MGAFCFNFEQDFRDFLHRTSIPVDVYKDLEFAFRQVLARSWATAYDYQQKDAVIDFQSLSGARAVLQRIREGVERAENRYSATEYGFGPLYIYASARRASARAAYRKALVEISRVFSSNALGIESERSLMRETWLSDLRLKLDANQNANQPQVSFCVSLTVATLTTFDHEYFVDYVSVAHAVFLPYFQIHFENSFGTSDHFYEFLVLKMSMEADRPVQLTKFKEVAEEILEATQLEARRLGLNGNDLVQSASTRQMIFPGLKAS